MIANSDLKSAPFDHRTEGLRALAALMVLYTHFLVPDNSIDPGFSPSPFFFQFEAGHGAVLFFFVLSGYVIGLTNTGPYSIPAVRSYLVRRAVRLIPLYLLAVVLSLPFLGPHSSSTVLGHLLMLQNALPYGSVDFPLLSSNTNLWSLNYEALYYLLFLLVWRFRTHWHVFATLSLFVACLAWPLGPFGLLASSYATGWLFWLAGYWLALSPRPPDLGAAERLPWPSLIMLWLAVWHMKPLFWLCHRFFTLPERGWISYSFLDFIVPCLSLMLVSSGRRPVRWKYVVWGTLALPLAFMAWRILRGRWGPDDPLFIYDLISIAALLLWRWRPSPDHLSLLAPIGMVSYSLYIFHRPFEHLISSLPHLPSGNLWTFLLRICLIALLTFAFSWLAERYLQPRLKLLLLSKLVAPKTREA